MISILCPCYNEQEVMPAFFERIFSVMQGISEPYEIICVNDGSSDSTFEILKEFAEKDDRIKVIDLSRNFGQDAALTAALDYSQGDAVIPIDADLQDPPELIKDMIQKWHEGYEVVLARRVDRSVDPWLKRTLAKTFYRINNLISKPNIPENVGNFRLMDKCVVNALLRFRESHRFLRGLFAWAGFKTCIIDYTRGNRISGIPKYNSWRSWKLAVEGITSFSTTPLTLWFYLGSAISFCAFLYGLYIFIKTLILGIDVPGYASLVCLILFFGGLQLLGIGVMGEYLGRTYIESKQRPVYLVREIFCRRKQKDSKEEIQHAFG